MKRKAIYMAVLTAVVVAVGLLGIKKVYALDNAFYHNAYTISGRDMNYTGFSTMFVPVPLSNGSYGLGYIDAPNISSYIYFDLTYNSGLESTLWVNYFDGTNYYNVDSCYLESPYILFTIMPSK